MRLPSRHISRELAHIERRAILTRRKPQRVAVCLIGYTGRVPRAFGDNAGAWPVRIAVTKKPRSVAKRPDLESPLHPITVLEMAWVATQAHAKRLKAKLDRLLLGTSEESRKLRHGWRDAEAEPEVLWPVLLEEALREIRKREKFEVFSA